MKLDEAIATVADREASIEELPVAAGLKMLDGDTLAVGDSSYRLVGEGLRRCCEQVSAPAAYLSDLPARIREQVLQHHFDRCRLRQGQITLIGRQGEFLAFGRSDLLRLSGREVLEAVQAGVDVQLDVHKFEIASEAFQADLLVEKASEEVAPGDFIHAGIRVTHSLIGDHATWIESFIFRQVCENGMTHRDCVLRRAARTRKLPIGHPEARELQKQQVRRLAAETSSALRQKLDAILQLRREDVNVDQLLGRWLDQARLSRRRWMPTVRNAWQGEGGRGEATAYRVMNALTWLATHGDRLSARHRRILSGLAGVLAFRQIHICPHCFSQLGGPATVAEGEE